MTEKRQTSQSYIIRILQHFATRLRNITNFVMLFQGIFNTMNWWDWVPFSAPPLKKKNGLLPQSQGPIGHVLSK
jgi:hypothetical protein